MTGTLDLLRGLMGAGLSRQTAFELVTHFCGVTAAQALADKEVDPAAAEKVLAAEKRLSEGEPIQYILGQWSFCGRKIYCRRGVLIPREDTETLVAKAKDIAKNAQTALDLCCGSGCVGIALAADLPLSVTAVDIDGAALSLTRENAALWGVEERVRTVKKDILNEKIEGKYDLIVSNPPYIKSGEIASLSRTVAGYEPRLALDGGKDGLVFYRKLAQIACENLEKGGAFACEIGFDQKDEVCAIFAQKGFKPSCTVDFNGCDRVISFKNEG